MIARRPSCGGLAGLVMLAATPTWAQVGPPDRVPDGATFATGDVSLTVQPLSLPEGFGIPTAASEPLPLQPPSPVASSRPVAPLEQVAAAAPPASVPANASFATAEVTLGSATVDPLPVGDLQVPFAVLDLGGYAFTVEGDALRFTLGADVLFDFDKAELCRGADPVLRELMGEVAARIPDASFLVEGHTDAKGSDAYNDRLGGRRAAAVQAWLTRSGGVAPGRVATSSLGERRPVAPNTKPDGSDDPEGRQKNRRVEVVVSPAS